MPDRDVNPGLSEMDGPFCFSERQREVLCLAAEGCTDREIAQQLALSVYTVQDHLRKIRNRMGARNTTHAVMMAMQSGLIFGESATGGGEGYGSRYVNG
jgi:DNA-binding NarL/FixJ family response regulator